MINARRSHIKGEGSGGSAGVTMHRQKFVSFSTRRSARGNSRDNGGLSAKHPMVV